MEVSCERCKKVFEDSSLLKHIVQDKACESHYGSERLNEMKKQKKKLKMQQYRKRLSIQEKKKINEKQREYDQLPETKEKRKQISDPFMFEESTHV